MTQQTRTLQKKPLTSTGFEQTDSLLSQWHLPRFQNALQCTIFHLTDVPGFHQETFSNAARKTEGEKVAYASMHPLSMIQSSTHALTSLPDSSNRLFSLMEARASINMLNICYSPDGRFVLGKTVPSVLGTARGPRPILIIRMFSWSIS